MACSMLGGWLGRGVVCSMLDGWLGMWPAARLVAGGVAYSMLGGWLERGVVCAPVRDDSRSISL